MATALIQKIKFDKGTFLYSGESREQNREDKVTSFSSVTYTR